MKIMYTDARATDMIGKWKVVKAFRKDYVLHSEEKKLSISLRGYPPCACPNNRYERTQLKQVDF